jgi:D-arabinose 5-phosphate isomerase GutQ
MNNEVLKRYNQQKHIRNNIHKALKPGIENKKIGVIGLGKSIYKLKKLDKSINKLGNQFVPTKKTPPKNSYKGYN